MTYDSSRDWISLSNRQEIMDIVDHVSPLFKDKIRDEANNPARVINVDNISYNSYVASNFVEFRVIAFLGSDQGKYEQNIIIKQFRTTQIYEEELNNLKKIENQLASHPNINLTPLIYNNDGSRYLVFEEISGIQFQHLGIPIDIKHYFLGLIHASFHGEEKHPLDENTIREFMIFLLLHLPLTDEERDGIGQVLEKHFAKIASSSGGCYVKPNLGTENMVFQQQSGNITLLNIKQGQGIKVFIGPDSCENLVKDRMFDLAQIFAFNAFEEYSLTGEVLRTKELMSAYITGYLEYYQTTRTPIIKTLYPDGITLDLYFLAHIWLNEVEKAQPSEIDPTSLVDRQFLIFTYYILTEEPFANVFGIY